MSVPIVVSLSGGKDSTALLLMMLERGDDIHSVVYFDSGTWEWPQMHTHIDKLESYVGMKFVRLSPGYSFDHWMFERNVIASKGELKGKVRYVGMGWPWANLRWCTGKKLDAIGKHLNSVGDHSIAIGIASDERHRATATTKTKVSRYAKAVFPLIDMDVTESHALEYCYARGFDWDGLYRHFHRLSCWCCPLQSMAELRNLRRYYPDMWARLMDMDDRSRNTFKGDKSVRDLDARFREEDRQFKLPGVAA